MNIVTFKILNVNILFLVSVPLDLSSVFFPFLIQIIALVLKLQECLVLFISYPVKSRRPAQGIFFLAQAKDIPYYVSSVYIKPHDLLHLAWLK